MASATALPPKRNESRRLYKGPFSGQFSDLMILNQNPDYWLTKNHQQSMIFCTFGVSFSTFLHGNSMEPQPRGAAPVSDPCTTTTPPPPPAISPRDNKHPPLPVPCSQSLRRLPWRVPPWCGACACGDRWTASTLAKDRRTWGCHSGVRDLSAAATRNCHWLY